MDGRALWSAARSVLGRLELRLLATMVAAGAALMAFLAVSDEVGENETGDFDRAVLLWFREPYNSREPVGSHTLEEAMRDITALGGFTFLTLATVVAVASLLFFRKWRHAVVLGVTVLLAQAASEVLKVVYGRPRPDLVPHEVYVYSHSFPSGHSTLSAATYLTLAAVLATLAPRMGFKVFVFVLAILLTVAVGVSRVYLGVHWPTDVLGGWTLGAAWALAARVVLALWLAGSPGRPARG